MHTLKSALDNICVHLEIKFYMTIGKQHTFHYFYWMDILPEGVYLLDVNIPGLHGGPKLACIRSPGTGLTCGCDTQDDHWELNPRPSARASNDLIL